MSALVVSFLDLGQMPLELLNHPMEVRYSTVA